MAAGSSVVSRTTVASPAAIAATRSRSAPADALGRARELTGWLETFWRGEDDRMLRPARARTSPASR
ncbi:hypothetical protein JHV666_49700 [Mycobacterium avium subsp. hominissuis]